MPMTYMGAPCRHGHMGERYTRDNRCVTCRRIEARVQNKSPHRMAQKLEYNRRPEVIAARKAREQDPIRRARHKTPEVRAAKRRRHGLPEPTRPEPQICESCGKPPGKKGLNLDHCHKSGKFRGWLCSPCNVGIGMLGDDIDGLQRAIRYLDSIAHGNLEQCP